ncbi:P-loop containing nucleoside triphosphate hydrolase protein [Paraphysoderma sedebokerense]|nr:P-loop containing nucleoside triphosphate hydrolase protein [Paraphysoderma sedebokerense]
MTAYEIARRNLHVSSVPESLPCREEQFYTILDRLQDMLTEQSGGCIYISGVPGTGKTATVMEVLRTLDDKVNEGELPKFHLTLINGMKVTDPHQAYSLFYESLTGKRVTPTHAADLLKNRFESPRKTDQMSILLLDELDLLLTKKQTLLYNFLDWPNRPNSRFIVIAIANTMDLPERMLSLRVASRLGLTRVEFLPYTNHQLEEILLKRLEGTDVFEPGAIRLATLKVANVTGDARKLLDIARRAVENVEQRNPASVTSKLDGLQKVTTQIMNETINNMYSSLQITYLKSTSKFQKLFMYVVVGLVNKSGLGEVQFSQVCFNVASLLTSVNPVIIATVY